MEHPREAMDSASKQKVMDWLADSSDEDEEAPEDDGGDADEQQAQEEWDQKLAIAAAVLNELDEEQAHAAISPMLGPALGAPLLGALLNALRPPEGHVAALQLNGPCATFLLFGGASLLC